MAYINDMSPLQLCAAVGFTCLITGMYLSNTFARLFLGLGTDKDEPDKVFTNGLSALFIFKVLIQGPSLDTIVKLLSSRIRRRLYVAHKHWLFFGNETWWVGHPAIAAHAFGISQQKMWRKLTKDETLNLFYQSAAEKQHKGMLYTGDDEGWKAARSELTPFFYKTDFTKLDDRMDSVCQKHLQRIAMKHHGEEELLELLLTVTVDLLCQCLYRCALPADELQLLTEAMAEYTVPGTTKHQKFPGNLDALDYHTKVAGEMAEDAPEETLAFIIKNKCPSLSDELKSENIAFFLEALTPAFASFWTICNISMMTNKYMKEKPKTDAVFRQQCIKESLRMYPPVPILWPRQATCDQEMANPLFGAPAITRSWTESLFGGTPIEKQPTIKIKKGTTLILFPGVYHYDDRFWVRPMEFIPDRWDKEPDVLQGDTAKFEHRKRNTQFPGLVGSKADTMGYASSRVSMLASNARSKGTVSKSLRASIFGTEHELHQAESSKDHLFETTMENVSELQAWSFLPFGLGPHTCMGRRLAIAMVDSIVYNFLEYDVAFYNGVVPSLFTRKNWHERTMETAAAYNFPADPVLIQLKRPKATKARVSVFGAAIDETKEQ